MSAYNSLTEREKIILKYSLLNGFLLAMAGIIFVSFA
jgi:hypothetical protein